jgi:hypothetical protein
MTLRINEQTPISRLRDAQDEVVKAGCTYDLAKRAVNDFKAACRGLIEDEAIVRRRQELSAERDRLFHVLQEKIALVSFYRSAMPPKDPQAWKRHAQE